MKLFLTCDKSKKSSNTVRIKFVMKITLNKKEVMMSDSKNGNTNWKDSNLVELKQIYNFNPLDYIGPINSTRIPPIHNNIQVYHIYNYKQDGTYKTLMVASGNMNVPNLNTYYSSVI